MSDHDDIRTLLKRYETSLNTSDADLAAGCYTADGVFMPTTLPTAIGPSMRDAYADLFTAISLDVEFTIDELVVDSDELAYALTRSTGTQTVLSTGSAGTESNRELFLLRKETGSWKIARYMFNKAQ
jgi:uncharacterized protein (TIGR02246 family)